MNNQRWKNGRDSYRPIEPINTRAYEVAPIADDNTPKAFVRAHHYSGTFPAARFRFGLYRGAELVGVAVFSHPMNNRTLTNVFTVPATDAVELGRFVLLDDVPGNGETWFLGRCFEYLRSEIAGVVSFSDPVPRSALDGRVVFPGHIGTIYQAHNAVYLGLGARGKLLVLPDGHVFNHRTETKIVARARGSAAAIAVLESFGADAIWSDRRAWLNEWIPKLTRPMPHPGNYKYAWALDRALRKPLMKRARPYPKTRLERGMQSRLPFDEAA